ncbi:UDP-N-acetylglucosamine transferase subunit ALG14 homolog [Saccostrea echinata]|uniref:UDP-N-acetylglucosamine transferase subunit ALG14 homolog n=1 Tax=Saccostrea echinata TaxID=191078 RepID=UPI002A7F2D06|nr:UDP-N-acetylglucosamine transferase subunit ALG14 homolog [Saccostrea echinata]
MLILLVAICIIFLAVCFVFIVTRAVYDRRKSTVSVLAVMGSGGHTKEMLSLLSGLGTHYHPRYYVIANTDTMSQQKVKQFEKQRNTTEKNKSEYSIILIPRSREVAQSWTSTVLSTLIALWKSFPAVFQSNPDLILCNGPGTCVPVCLVGIILKIVRMGKPRIVYVESICRVETLSLSAWMLYYLVDEMLVQWPSLQTKFPRTHYIGKLV